MKACVEYRITRLNAAALINFFSSSDSAIIGGWHLFKNHIFKITDNNNYDKQPFAPKYCARREKSLILQCIGFYMR